MEFVVKRVDPDKKKDEELMHHGILGQKWGVRRYQNEDGTYTEAGKKRYFGDAKEKLSNAWKKVTNVASDAAFETKWAVERAADAIKDVPKKVSYAVKDSTMSKSKRQAIQKYRESKEFGWDGSGKPNFGMTGKTVAKYATNGNAGTFFGPYRSYDRLKANGCRGVDIWMQSKQYLSNFNNMLYSDRYYTKDPMPDDYMYTEMLNANGTIDVEDADKLKELIKQKFKSASGFELTDKKIDELIKEYQEIAQIWNDMVSDINEQGMGDLFFNSDNKDLNYPMTDGSYADLQRYGESLGVDSRGISNDIERSKKYPILSFQPAGTGYLVKDYSKANKANDDGNNRLARREMQPTKLSEMSDKDKEKINAARKAYYRKNSSSSDK